jgi:hypothetical protein
MLASFLALAAAYPAHAQANACKTKVAITSIYGHQTGPGRYEYILQLQNLTRKPVNYQIDFKNMPQGVNAYKPSVQSSSPLAAATTTSVRFGSGTNSNMTLNSVSIGYDTPTSAVNVSNCK